MGTKKYKYIGICQREADEVKVHILKSVKKNESKESRLNYDDVSYVSVEQIKGILPPPSITSAGNRVYYEFIKNVDLCKKA